MTPAICMNVVRTEWQQSLQRGVHVLFPVREQIKEFIGAGNDGHDAKQNAQYLLYRMDSILVC
jgi:hypothetical protein